MVSKFLASQTSPQQNHINSQLMSDVKQINNAAAAAAYTHIYHLKIIVCHSQIVMMTVRYCFNCFSEILFNVKS